MPNENLVSYMPIKTNECKLSDVFLNEQFSKIVNNIFVSKENTNFIGNIVFPEFVKVLESSPISKIKLENLKLYAHQTFKLSSDFFVINDFKISMFMSQSGITIFKIKFFFKENYNFTIQRYVEYKLVNI